MNRHFITVLGTSLYTDCIYEVEGTDFGYRTPFVQMAVLRYIMPVCSEGDRITVLLTEKAEEMNWRTRAYTEAERRRPAMKNMQPAAGEQKTGLRELLKREYPDIPIESVRIKEGRNKAETDEIFEAIYGVIRSEETVYFDFTHGLRNLPMQALTVIHYAKVLKDIQVGGMYYGAFELGERREDGEYYVNLLDMSACSTILDWTSAAESFIKGGSSNQLKDLYKETVKPRKEQKNATQMINRLCDLTSCLNTGRGKYDKNDTNEKKSIQTAYDKFHDYYEKMCEDEQPVSDAPLLRLLDHIRGDVNIFDRKYWIEKEGRRIELENTATGMAAVQWAIDKNLTQQGFTALEETIKTWLCESYEIPAGDKEERDGIVGRTLKFMANQQIRKIHPSGGSKEEELSRGALKDRLLAEFLMDPGFEKRESEEKERYLKKIERMVMNLSEELLDVSSAVSDQRNSLNHFGFQMHPAGYDKLQKNLVKRFEELQEIMKQDGVHITF